MTEPTSDITHLLSRRHVLGGAAALGVGILAAACGDDSSGGSGTTTKSSTSLAPGTTKAPVTTAPGGNVDLTVAKLAAGLEVLAVGTYKAALDAAGAGALGDVPPAVAEFVTVAMAHHQAHLDAWNGVLTGAGEKAVTEPNATLKPTVDSEFAKVKDVTGAATLALLLEQIAAATYLNAQEVLTDKSAIELAGSIQIIDAQHASILLFVLGKYPVPDTFALDDLAAAA